MIDNKPNSEKRWVHILTITIIIIVEGFIFYASFIHAGNASALSYISFAGTLISIILAVLAIGYTYGESVKQKNSGDTVVNQINRLNEVIKNIELESESLKEISVVKKELIKFSAMFEKRMGDTHVRVEDMNNALHDFFDKEKSKTVNNKDMLFQVLEDSKNSLFDLTYMLIYLAINTGTGDIVDRLNDTAIKYGEITLKDDRIKTADSNLPLAFTGNSLVITKLLTTYDILIIAGDNYTIDNKFEKMIFAVVDEPNEGNDFIEVYMEKLKEGIKKYKK